MIRVLSASTNRADLSIMAPVWRAIVERRGMELHLLLTGAHATNAKLIGAAAPNGARLHRGGGDPGGSTSAAATVAMAAITAFAGEVIAEVQPDILLVIGDRMDMFPIAAASVPFNTPLVHLHGGEISHGAVDDRLRHAISKLAHGHCAGCQPAAENLMRMGEEPDRIRITGGPGLDTLLAAPHMSDADLALDLGLDSLMGLRLVTIHPETNKGDSLRLVEEVTAALEAVPGPTVVTASNSDPGGENMSRALESWCSSRSWASWRANLGMRLYPPTMRAAAALVGNSSSGIVEAGLFGVPVIDVGRRQDGRPHGRNVLRLPADRRVLTEALRSHPRSAPSEMGRRSSLYGDGHAAPRIAAFVADVAAWEHTLDKRLYTAPPGIYPSLSVPWSDEDRDP
ncbi:MAG: UDP-N-acetylglucosamine 2-epimerase [Rhodospirillum sp.]|nr:UDP-N-acetylglucosamine 2-epimerase [Rhodospirillum sp.]MCF8489118.1 UDP-N-acetylglucosamine 2-epimerase [Rhodospirillum sp.]MCF8498908.1 UDP-N-acetylglucosamine 2-epimerase [Rhodospirillum sp.]